MVTLTISSNWYLELACLESFPPSLLFCILLVKSIGDVFHRDFHLTHEVFFVIYILCDFFQTLSFLNFFSLMVVSSSPLILASTLLTLRDDLTESICLLLRSLLRSLLKSIIRLLNLLFTILLV